MVLRAFLWFLVIAVLSVLAAWLAREPGTVSLTWGDWRVDTSLAILLVAGILVVAVTAWLYRAWRVLRGAPGAIGRGRRERRLHRGYLALTRGMAAVAAGDPAEAQRHAREANALLHEPPLTLLLSAQAAQLEGNETRARQLFNEMLGRPETEFLGLRGLLLQAEREGNATRVLELARRARLLRPKSKWVLATLLEMEARAGNWKGAAAALGDAVKHGILPPEGAAASRATMLLQQALEAEAAGDGVRALKLSRKAREANAASLPAAVDLAGRLLAADKPRQVVRLVEDCWPTMPHPDLARAWGQAAKARDSVRRLQALDRLRRLNPEHPESLLALARAALDARLWGETRRFLKKAARASGAPAARLCRMMAEVEEAEHGNTHDAREWLARAAEAPPDPHWVCGACGASVPAWNALCGHCGAFGEIDWRAPPRVTPAAGETADLAALPLAEPAAPVAPARPVEDAVVTPTAVTVLPVADAGGGAPAIAADGADPAPGPDQAAAPEDAPGGEGEESVRQERLVDGAAR